MIDLVEVGVTYQSQGMLFVVVGWEKNEWAESVATCLILDDHPKFKQRLLSGTLMRVGVWSTVWEEAMKIASLPEQGKVDP